MSTRPLPVTVGEEARVPVHTRSAGVETEVREDNPWFLKSPVAVAERGPDPGISEADNIRAADSPDIGEETQVAVDTPSSGLRLYCDVRHTEAAHGARHVKLIRGRLRPRYLVPCAAAIL
jgi:hypothetical protein